MAEALEIRNLIACHPEFNPAVTMPSGVKKGLLEKYAELYEGGEKFEAVKEQYLRRRQADAQPKYRNARADAAHHPEQAASIIDLLAGNAFELTPTVAADTEDETQKNQHLKEHVSAVHRHVEQLGNKNYQDLYQMESPDFVLLFIPIESAFAVALNEDTSLYNKAFEKNIVIVTPSTLLATLRTIDSMWTNQKQQENALEIARQAGALYDKFEGFVGDLIKIGKKMDEAKMEYGAAMNKLTECKGNLITSVEKLKK